MQLKKVYLAIPYTKMEESSFEQATRATAFITNNFNLNVFSPITHSHPLTVYGVRGDWEFWQQIDYQYIDFVDEVWVLIPREGKERVKSSVGVNAELIYAKNNGKVIKYFTLENDIITFYNDLN